MQLVLCRLKQGSVSTLPDNWYVADIYYLLRHQRIQILEVIIKVVHQQLVKIGPNIHVVIQHLITEKPAQLLLPEVIIFKIVQNGPFNQFLGLCRKVLASEHLDKQIGHQLLGELVVKH